jgi:ferritin-like metal-binding protein YciE
MDVAITKMLSAANMDDLKAVFAAEYKLASAEQKTALKAKYDEIKKEFE